MKEMTGSPTYFFHMHVQNSETFKLGEFWQKSIFTSLSHLSQILVLSLQTNRISVLSLFLGFVTLFLLIFEVQRQWLQKAGTLELHRGDQIR